MSGHIHTKEEETRLRRLLKNLDAEKNAIENEADAIFLELNSPPSEGVVPAGLEAPLVDAMGFPRSDVDVYRIRTLRNQFRILQTDHKEIQRKIERLLTDLATENDSSKNKDSGKIEMALRLAPKPKPKYDLSTGKWVVKNWNGSVAGVDGGDKITFDDLSKNIDGTNRECINDKNNGPLNCRSNEKRDEIMIKEEVQTAPKLFRVPFAKVDGVSHPSPASNAGLKVDDNIIQFGHLNADNNSQLFQAIAKLVPEVAAENGSIEITVLRPQSQQQVKASNSTETSTTNSTAVNNKTSYSSDHWKEITLVLYPQQFSGRALLGCHIVPFVA